jgi:ABC-2 type transport system ATP-binding protein
MNKVIEINNLTKNYGKHRGVVDVTFSVKQGDIFGFLGPNGAGKSTTIRSMLGFLKYESGSIRLLGHEASAAHENILKEIGYMPSESMFYSGMKGKEIIRFAAEVRGIDCSKEAEKLCERLNIDVNKKIADLSLGNRKKVSIVCAMQHRPKLFIFDEPTSGLDPLMQNIFFELIEEYVSEGATCLLSTHVLSEVRNYCRNVGIMKDGKLLCVDSVENMLKGNTRRVRYESKGRKIDYLFSGSTEKLIQKLAGKRISDLYIEEPSIEDIFIHYYEKEN